MYGGTFFSREQKFALLLNMLKLHPQLSGQNLVALSFDTDIQLPNEKNPVFTVWKIG